jgi:hypothetical protein
MKHKREFDTSYFHNPHVQGVNYSLFIMLLKETMLMESKGATRSGSDSVFPHILAVFRSVSCVLCFSAAPSRNHQRRVYVVSFRSNPIHGVQDYIKMTLMARDGPRHAAMSVACMVGPLLALVASPIEFFFSGSCVSQENDVANSLGLSDAERSIKLKNMQKQGNLLHSVKTG